MKKFFLVKVLLIAVCACAFGQYVSAQDLILTRESDIIEASIFEIGDDFVSYKPMDSLDGPMYKIATARIVKIKFKNGTEKVFNKLPQQYPGQGYGLTAPTGALSYSKGDLYCAGRKLSESEMRSMLPMEIFENVNGGLNMRKHGKRLIIAGSILAGIGAVSTGLGIALDEPISFIMGCSELSSGFICLGVGIPVYCVGQYRAKKAASEFNVANNYPEISFNIGSTRNGIGLTMSF